MLVREGTERNDLIDLSLAALLASIAGALNAAAFHAVGFFAANMTGNLSTLSDHLASIQWSITIFYLGILIAFISGATCSAMLINAGRERTWRIYAYALLIEAIILLGVGFGDLSLHGDWRITTVVLGLAFAMGFQNALGSRLSDSRVRTTHISGTATDIGIELAALINRIRRLPSDRSSRFNSGKLRLQLCTILCFLAGGLVGSLLYRTIGGFLILIAATILLSVSLSTIAQSFRAGAPSNGQTEEKYETQ